MNRRNIYYLAAAAIVLLIAVFSLFKKPDDSFSHNEDAKELVAEEKESVMVFGIPKDSFRIEEIAVEKNEMLSNILLSRGISYSEIDEIAKKSKSVFDVRKIKAGNSLTFFWTKDSLPKVDYMVYEKNMEEFIRYSLADSIIVESGSKDIYFEQREVVGEIESNLWNSLVSKDVSPVLSLEMMDVYQWTIDFAGIQKGDTYQIIYEVKMIDGEAFGINRVLASSFTNSGKEHYAFAFEQNGRIEYFDENGESLRRAFLKAPLDYRRISSGYSNSRLHPIHKVYRPHKGIDYAASAGTQVVSIGDGKVVKIAYDKASGHYVKIKHNAVYTSGYLHLQRRPNLKLGQFVKQKQEIGKVGMTGHATGPHLDFRIWKNGQLVNPANVKSPPVEPVQEANRSSFDSLASTYIQKLEYLGLELRAVPNIPE